MYLFWLGRVLVAARGLSCTWDLRSPTRDRTCNPLCWISKETPLPSSWGIVISVEIPQSNGENLKSKDLTACFLPTGASEGTSRLREAG